MKIAEASSMQPVFSSNEKERRKPKIKAFPLSQIYYKLICIEYIGKIEFINQ